MRIAHLALSLVALLAVVYVAALLTSPLLFSIVAQVCCYLALLLLFTATPGLAWRLLPARARARLEPRRTRFGRAVLLVGTLFALGGWALNHTLLPLIIKPVSLAADALLAAICAALLWTLVAPTLRSIALTAALVSSLVVLVAWHQRAEALAAVGGAELAQLRSLPYLTGVPGTRAGEGAGVTVFDENAASPGLNLLSSNGQPGAALIDMEGSVRHRWRPELSGDDWHHTELGLDLALWVIVKDALLARVDWDSRVVWSARARVHHDLALGEGGEVHTLARTDEVVFAYGLPFPVLTEQLLTFSSTGELVQTRPLYPVVRSLVPLFSYLRSYKYLIAPQNLWYRLGRLARGGPAFLLGSVHDLLHTNTLELLRGEGEGLHGNGFLLCFKAIDLVAVLDPTAQEVTWHIPPGMLQLPHHPTLLPGGTLLVFDNGVRRGWTRVLELEPSSLEVLWEYQSQPPRAFYTSWGGANQRLPNGNTLITESDEGRVFEITPNGGVVWELYNPERTPQGERATIYRMMRLVEPIMLEAIARRLGDGG